MAFFHALDVVSSFLNPTQSLTVAQVGLAFFKPSLIMLRPAPITNWACRARNIIVRVAAGIRVMYSMMVPRPLGFVTAITALP